MLKHENENENGNWQSNFHCKWHNSYLSRSPARRWSYCQSFWFHFPETGEAPDNLIQITALVIQMGCCLNVDKIRGRRTITLQRRKEIMSQRCDHEGNHCSIWQHQQQETLHIRTEQITVIVYKCVGCRCWSIWIYISIACWTAVRSDKRQQVWNQTKNVKTNKIKLKWLNWRLYWRELSGQNISIKLVPLAISLLLYVWRTHSHMSHLIDSEPGQWCHNLKFPQKIEYILLSKFNLPVCHFIGVRCLFIISLSIWFQCKQ